MKAKILGLLTIVILAASCGTNKDFHKKHHKHRKWIKVGEKTNPDFAAKEEIKTINDKTEIKKSEDAVPASEVIVEDKTTAISNTVKSETKTIERVQKSRVSSGDTDEIPTDISNEAVISHDIDSATSPKNTENTVSKKTVKQTIKDGRKDVKEKSTGELLLLALLIVLIIVAFSFLDGLLGGLLGAILIVFLVLLLLRYFGVI